MFQHINLFRTALLVLIFISFQQSSLYAQYNIDSLHNLLITAENDSTKTKILFELGRQNWFKRNIKDASYYLNQSIKLAEQTGHKRYLSDGCNLLANVYMKRELFDSAFFFLEKGLAQRDEKFIPLIDETYSKLYYQLGDYQSSLNYAVKSADGFEKSSTPEFQLQSVFAYLMIGDIFNNMGQKERGLEYYKKAYERGRDAGEDWYIKTPLQRIAEYYLSKNELGKAKHLYDTIIEIDKDAINFEPTMYSYEGLGNVAMKQNEFKKAIGYYRLALQYAKQTRMSINIENFYAQLGSAFLGDLQRDSALHYLQTAIALSARSKNYANLTFAFHELSILNQQQKKYPDALTSFQLHKSYHDSLLSVEKIKAVNNLEILYRTRQNENEILRLQQAQQEKDFAIKKRNIYIIIGMGLLTTLAVIIILLRLNYRNKQSLQEEKVRKLERQQQILSLQSMINGQEAERTRIAKDLHDGLGGLFSTVKMYFSALEHEHSNLKTNEVFKKSYSLVDNASVEIRRIAHNMMPEVLLKLGLINAVKDLCDNISAGRSLNVSLEVHGMNGRLKANTEVMLYRIIQELLNNIMKHANATQAIIQFIKDDDRFSVVVEDNGQGFETDQTDEKTHAGLSTIRNRVNYLNGKLTIDSQKNVGTTVMMDFLINKM